MENEKNIEKTVDGKAEGNNNNTINNVEKVEKMIKDAAKLTANWKKNRDDNTAKQNAIDAGKSVIAALDSVKIEGFIKISGTWYRKSALSIDDWCKLSDKICRAEIEDKHGKATYLVVCLFDVQGMVLNDGQGTKCLFAGNGNGNIWKTKTQLNKEFGIATAGRNISRDPNAAAVRALTTFSAAIGIDCDVTDLDDAAETIKAAAKSMIDNMSKTAKELKRQKAIAAAAAKMTAVGKVKEEDARKYAAEIYKEGSKLTDDDRNLIVTLLTRGKSYKEAVAIAS